MKLYALFPDSETLENARNALEGAGYGDAVERVSDPASGDEGATESAGDAPVAAGANQGTGTVVAGRGATAPQGTGAGLDDLALDEDSRAFLDEQMTEGSRLMELEVDDDQGREGSELRSLLDDHASHVITA